MERHFAKAIENLKDTILQMGDAAIVAVQNADKAFLAHDKRLANHVVISDETLNKLEVAIDNHVLDLLALQQPVAVDLRLILASYMICSEFERIGDHAVNIAQSAMNVADLAGCVENFNIPRMITVTEKMLLDAVESFREMDTTLAESVLRSDDEADECNRQTTKQVIEAIKTHPEQTECGLEMIRVSKNLERVADLATNIAEEVIFYLQARNVKHNIEGKV